MEMAKTKNQKQTYKDNLDSDPEYFLDRTRSQEKRRPVKNWTREVSRRMDEDPEWIGYDDE